MTTAAGTFALSHLLLFHVFASRRRVMCKCPANFHNRTRRHAFNRNGRVDGGGKPKNTVTQKKKVDVDGFTSVEKKRRPRSSRNRNKRGTAATPAESTTLRAVEPTINIYLSRFDENTSEDVLRFVPQRARGRCQELEEQRETGLKCYVLQVLAKHKVVLLGSNFR